MKVLLLSSSLQTEKKGGGGGEGIELFFSTLIGRRSTGRKVVQHIVVYVYPFESELSYTLASLAGEGFCTVIFNPILNKVFLLSYLHTVEERCPPPPPLQPTPMAILRLKGSPPRTTSTGGREKLMTPADAGERLPFSGERAHAARLPGGKRATARERRGGHGGGTRGKRPFGSLLRKREEEGNKRGRRPRRQSRPLLKNVISFFKDRNSENTEKASKIELQSNVCVVKEAQEIIRQSSESCFIFKNPP